MGKFEASHTGCTVDKTTGNVAYTGNEVLMTKPGVTSWRNIEIGDAFITAQEMNKTGNPYGLNTNDNVVDPHMVKNSEWGAVAYLSKSKYGKQNEEVYINNNSNYITGIAGDTADAGQSTAATNTYKTEKGMKASTNGNPTGIYDMSGGNWERTAAYVNNGYDNLITYGLATEASRGGLTDANTPSKYRDVYESTLSNAEESEQGADYNLTEPNKKGKYGDAIWETSGGTGTSNPSNQQSWHSDSSLFPYSERPFFGIGGGYNDTSIAGGLYFSRSDGNAAGGNGFRVVVPAF